MRTYQRGLAVVCLLYVILVVGANVECAPKYFERADVIVLLVGATSLGIALFWASLADNDADRVTGSLASAGLAGLMLQPDFVIAIVPLAIVGALRLPRRTALRVSISLAAPLVLLAAAAAPYVGEGYVRPEQLLCL